MLTGSTTVFSIVGSNPTIVNIDCIHGIFRILLGCSVAAARFSLKEKASDGSNPSTPAILAECSSEVERLIWDQEAEIA